MGHLEKNGGWARVLKISFISLNKKVTLNGFVAEPQLREATDAQPNSELIAGSDPIFCQNPQSKAQRGENDLRTSPPPPVPRNRQYLTAEPGGGSYARFPPKIRPRNQGLVLAHDPGQPRTVEKNFGRVAPGHARTWERLWYITRNGGGGTKANQGA